VTDTVCVDASVAAKWLMHEIDRPLALSLRTHHLGQGGTFIAPPQFSGEMASAIYKKERAQQMTEQNARLLTANIVDLGVQLFDHRETVTAGLEIALRFNLKWIYDAFYVALADIVGCDMWTADTGLYRAVNPAFPNVHLLAELRRP